MSGSTINNQPFLLAGAALAPLPPLLLQPFLDAAMLVLNRRHPNLFERMDGLRERTFLISPVDFPFDFLLRPAPPPNLAALAKEECRITPTATIEGPLLTLIQLLEGQLDGDALFFSRDLSVEGDMEAVVALRNTVDGAGIVLQDDLLSVLGPLARPVGAAVDGSVAIMACAYRDLSVLKKTLTTRFTGQADPHVTEPEGLRKR